jgi:trimethylamine--corrinoid protein Co-methyltransferase
LSPKTNYFKAEDVHKIHSKSLDLIEEVGFKLDDIDILKRLKKFDTNVDLGNRTIKIPRKVADYFLKKVPGEITLYAIDPKYDIELGKKRVYRPISGSININEYEYVTDFKKDITTRKANSKDVENVAKIVQYLDLIHYNATAVLPNDVPEQVMDITAAKICFKNCSKHILVDTLNKRSFEAVLEMAFKIAGSEEEFKRRPFFQVHFPATSPFIFDKNACDNAQMAARYNIPIRVASSPMSGLSGPIKLAGNLAVMHTEIIGGTIITQMLNEGCPVFYGSAPSIFDMRFATFSWGAAEAIKMCAAAADLARHCNMFYTTVGFATDSKLPDQQAAIERSMNLLSGALSGVDIFAGAGLLEGELTYDAAQLIIDNEIAKYVENILRGIEVNDEALSFDLIKGTGIGGNFLETEQTLVLFKTEHEQTELLDRRARGVWDDIKEKSIYEKALKTAKDIISQRSYSVLSDKIIGDIEEIYSRYLN